MVANVTSVAVFLTTAGVTFVVAAALVPLPELGVLELELEDPPPPEELAVHCATHVIAAALIVTETPTPMVEPLLQLHPANV